MPECGKYLKGASRHHPQSWIAGHIPNIMSLRRLTGCLTAPLSLVGAFESQIANFVGKGELLLQIV